MADIGNLPDTITTIPVIYSDNRRFYEFSDDEDEEGVKRKSQSSHKTVDCKIMENSTKQVRKLLSLGKRTTDKKA